METNHLAMHEALELHELLAFKNVCLTKSHTMQALVNDNDLKKILQKDVETTRRHIHNLQKILSEKPVEGGIQ